MAALRHVRQQAPRISLRNAKAYRARRRDRRRSRGAAARSRSDRAGLREAQHDPQRDALSLAPSSGDF